MTRAQQLRRLVASQAQPQLAPPTPRQAQALAYMRQYLTTNHRLPSIAALAQAFSITPNAVNCILLALKKKGYLEPAPDAGNAQPGSVAGLRFAHLSVAVVPADVALYIRKSAAPGLFSFEAVAQMKALLDQPTPPVPQHISPTTERPS